MDKLKNRGKLLAGAYRKQLRVECPEIYDKYLTIEKHIKDRNDIEYTKIARHTLSNCFIWADYEEEN